MNEQRIHAFFLRYQEFFRQGLRNEADLEQVASSYATACIAASPAGVMSCQNDEQLKHVMRQGFERYRQIGTKNMTLRDVRIDPVDEHHCLAHVAWTATYDRGSDPDVAIDFDVHYLVQQLDDEPKIFGWVSGDEQALLKRHGIL